MTIILKQEIELIRAKIDSLFDERDQLRKVVEQLTKENESLKAALAVCESVIEAMNSSNIPDTNSTNIK